MNLPYILFLLVCAFVWAKMEVQIEGRNGWAGALPTWRIEKHVLLDLFYGGRPLTGYHVWAFCLVFSFLHMPFFTGMKWTIFNEMKTLAAYYFFWVTEDFMWFVLNPDFGLKKFHPKYIWWHKKWFCGLPLDYWVLGCLGAILYYTAGQ